MFFASNTVGLPRLITPSLSMVYVVPPAVKVSPSLPVICPEASATVVRAARTLAGGRGAARPAVSGGLPWAMSADYPALVR